MILGLWFLDLSGSALRIQYAVKKTVYVTIEQPRSSLLPRYGPLEDWSFPLSVSELAGASQAMQGSDLLHGHGASRGPDTEPVLKQSGMAAPRKPTQLISTAPWLAPMAQHKITPARRAELQQVQKALKISMVKKYTDRRGKRRVARASEPKPNIPTSEAGAQDLRGSQVYPWHFAMEAS